MSTAISGAICKSCGRTSTTDENTICHRCQKLHSKTIVFFEPHPTGGQATIFIQAKKAIEHQRSLYPLLYQTDQQALDDFMACHWAYEVDAAVTPTVMLKTNAGWISNRINRS